jgi:hypothetical protein
MIVNLYIFRTDCPSTEEEWKSRSIELCESQPQNYHCMYNRNCQLEEFCAEAKYKNFEIYLKDSGQIFFTERQNKIYTNSMEYSIIQYNIYCKPNITSTTEKPIVSFTTGQHSTTVQPSTTVDNQENTIYETPDHCYVGWILFASLAGIVPLIYFTCTCIRKRNSETPRETVTQGQTDGNCSTTALEETPLQGGTDRTYSNATLPGNSQNSDIGELLTS